MCAGLFYWELGFVEFFTCTVLEVDQKWRCMKQQWSWHHYTLRVVTGKSRQRETQTRQQVPVCLILPHPTSRPPSGSAISSNPRPASSSSAVKAQRQPSWRANNPQTCTPAPPNPILAAGLAWVLDFPVRQGWWMAFLWLFNSPFQTFTPQALLQIRSISYNKCLIP